MTLGDKMVIGGADAPYKIAPGMRGAKLVSITEGEFEKMDWGTKPPTPTGIMIPSFTFEFAVKDDEGKLQSLTWEVTQKIRTKGMVSSLFKILKGLAPHPDKSFEDLGFSQELVRDLAKQAETKGVPCYLMLSVKEKGWAKIDSVLPLPTGGTLKEEKVAVTPEFDSDDVAF